MLNLIFYFVIARTKTQTPGRNHPVSIGNTKEVNQTVASTPRRSPEKGPDLYQVTMTAQTEKFQIAIQIQNPIIKVPKEKRAKSPKKLRRNPNPTKNQRGVKARKRRRQGRKINLH